jgi:hypothetical protein
MDELKAKSDSRPQLSSDLDPNNYKEEIDRTDPTGIKEHQKKFPGLWPEKEVELKIFDDLAEKTKQKSIGEIRVRTDFNVSGQSIVDEIKQKSADLINLCETLKGKDGRLASLAQTTYEEASMWAVKAATA